MKALSAVFGSFCLLATCLSALAQETVGADEIIELLTGNTVVGNWDGEDYRQYFNPDGSTIYATRQSASSLGKWRVNHQKNRFESQWSRPEWSGYLVVRQNEKLFWTTLEGKDPKAFEVVPGQQLVWSK